MSILIKGMDMPENCGKCPCCNWSDELDIYCCSALKGQPIIFNTSTKCSDCPLVEIPTPHGRLIDADRLIKALEKQWNVDDDQDFANKTVWREIESAPTVIEKE